MSKKTTKTENELLEQQVTDAGAEPEEVSDEFLSQTDPEPGENSDAAVQTGLENGNLSSDDQDPEPSDNTPPDAHQTAPETGEFPDNGTHPGNGIPETDPEELPKEEASKKTAGQRRRKTSKKDTVSQSGSDELKDSDPGENLPDESQSDDEQPENQSQQSRTRRRTANHSEPILAIDEQRSVETDEDKLRNDILDLVESMKGRKILTGTIQGVERSADNPDISYAVVYHGEFKIIIPAGETVEPPADFRDRSPGDVMHYMVTKRLGAEVDYIVKGVDPKTGIAAASRLDAMAQKRKDYYFGTDRDGNNLIYEGLCAEVRVVSVIRAGIFVDLFGLEIYIPLRELSYQRWMDADSHFQPGQRVLVKLLSLDRRDRSNVKVTASVKQAGENPYEKALRRYTVGSRYVGTVSMVDTNGVFVALDGGIDCLCSYPKRGRPPRGARVTVRIIGMNNETNRIWGAITHMTTPR